MMSVEYGFYNAETPYKEDLSPDMIIRESFSQKKDELIALSVEATGNGSTRLMDEYISLAPRASIGVKIYMLHIQSMNLSVVDRDLFLENALPFVISLPQPLPLYLRTPCLVSYMSFMSTRYMYMLFILHNLCLIFIFFFFFFLSLSFLSLSSPYHSSELCGFISL